MPTYVVLANWTDQGIRTVKKSPQRLDAIRKAIEAAGGKLLGFYLTIANRECTRFYVKIRGTLK